MSAVFDASESVNGQLLRRNFSLYDGGLDPYARCRLFLLVDLNVTLTAQPLLISTWPLFSSGVIVQSAC
jgi:hypothetical protein